MNLDELLKEARAALEQEREEAFTMYKRLYGQYPAEPAVWNGLGNCYCYGVGVGQSYEEAKSYYKMAADAGNAAAQYNYAYELERDGNPECVKWYEKCFENGDPEAAYRLSYIYGNTDIVEKDSALGTEWLRKSAEKGFAMAEADLGANLLNGENIARDEIEGRAWTQKAAEHGNGAAARNLSIIYRKGIGGAADIDLAVRWAIVAAEGDDHNTELAFDYATYYYNGTEGFPQDRQKALELYIAAGENGNIDAIGDLGLIYSNPRFGYESDDAKAIDWFERGARLGDEKCFKNLKAIYQKVYGPEADARYYVLAKEAAENGYYQGMVEAFLACVNGRGTEKDEKKALEYLEPAVQGEYAAALGFYGIAFRDGSIGFEKNLQKALEYFQKAADKGSIEACYQTGLLYNQGEGGIERDKEKSIQYLKMAAQAGHTEAMYTLAEVMTNGLGYGAMYENREAGEWVEKAAEGGHAKALFQLAFDAYIADNTEETMKWLNKGVQQNNTGCFNLLGDILYSGKMGQPKDRARAFEYFQKAAAVNNSSAILKVGKCYYLGSGVDKNLQEAFKYFERAAEDGLEEAKYFLAVMYSDGEGIPQNLYKAEQYLKEIIAVTSDEELRHHANFGLAYVYTKTNRTDEALEIYRALCEKPEDKGTSWHNMGLIYAKGDGVQKDMKLAKEYLEKAVAAGHDEAKKDLEIAEREIEKRTIPYDPKPQKKGCYIATSVYGSYDCPEVWTLRRFRDGVLGQTWYGRAFIKIYYTFSPSLVRLFGGNPLFKDFWKRRLDAMVARLNEEGMSGEPYQD